jgi:hypothetical protein
MAAAEKEIAALYSLKQLDLILHRAKLNHEGCKIID